MRISRIIAGAIGCVFGSCTTLAYCHLTGKFGVVSPSKYTINEFDKGVDYALNKINFGRVSDQSRPKTDKGRLSDIITSEAYFSNEEYEIEENTYIINNDSTNLPEENHKIANSENSTTIETGEG